MRLCKVESGSYVVQIPREMTQVTYLRDKTMLFDLPVAYIN